LLPYETVIELNTPEVVYPGRLFEINGGIRERAPSPSQGRRVSVELDGRLVSEVPAGPIHFQFAMPDDIAVGSHQLQVRIPEQGRFLPAKWTRTIKVFQITPRVHLSPPGWVLVPGRFSISGSVVSGLGLLRAEVVRVSLAGREYAQTTSESGSFHITGSLPAALNLGGPTEFSISVLPREPWFRPVTESHSVITVNLISLGLLFAILLLGVAVVREQVSERPLAGAVREASEPAMQAGAQPNVPAALVHVRGSLAEELIAIYRRVVRRLEVSSGIQAEVTTTLREFLHLLPVRPEEDTLWRLTVLAELALYSSYPVTLAEVEQVRALGMELEGASSGAQ
jgi:hypothetical protein